MTGAILMLALFVPAPHPDTACDGVASLYLAAAQDRDAGFSEASELAAISNIIAPPGLKSQSAHIIHLVYESPKYRHMSPHAISRYVLNTCVGV